MVTCSCGWTRECSSRWAAESVAKLHPKLSAPGIAHTLTIEEPPTDSAGRPQRTLGRFTTMRNSGGFDGGSSGSTRARSDRSVPQWVSRALSADQLRIMAPPLWAPAPGLDERLRDPDEANRYAKDSRGARAGVQFFQGNPLS